jgi:serine/threonine protein kinase
MFGSKQLPFPLAEEFEYDWTLQARLEKCQASNVAVSFARECLRLDPKQRPSASDLLKHDYFNDFREQFDDEIQTLLNYDDQDRRDIARREESLDRPPL